MAKKRKNESAPADETLQEIESVFDRIANWVSSNPAIFLGCVAGVLVLAAAVGFGSRHAEHRAEQAAAAVSELQRDYFRSSGSAVGVFAETTPANPEVAKQLKDEYLAKFLAAADEYSGSVAGIQALLEAATIKAELEGPAEAMELLRKAKAAASGSDLASLASMRIAGALELTDDLEGAAREYEEAANSDTFPGRLQALVEAARCYADAGDEQRAIALFARLESEAPDFAMRPHVRSRLQALSEGPVSTAAKTTTEE